MKTIRQIAEELGVSKQAVHQKRKSKALETALQPFTTTIHGTVYIEPEGESLLKQAFLKPELPTPSTVNVNSFTRVDGHVDGAEHQLYAILKEELAAKNKQIEQLQAQVSELTQANKALAQSINADRHNELAGTIREMIPEGVSEGEFGSTETFEAEEAQKSTQGGSDAHAAQLEAVRGLSWGEIIKTKFGWKKGTV